MIEILITILALIALLFGAYSDIRTREVADWANYSLLIAALALRLIYSLITWDFSYIIDGALGFAAMFLLALAMFYSGQWGGGDSKFLMGFGALIGLGYGHLADSQLIIFLINSMLLGAIISIIWSILLAVKHRKAFAKEINILRGEHKRIKIFFLIFLVVAVISSFIIKLSIAKIMVFLFFSIGVLTFYLWMFMKAVEKTCFIKDIPIEKVTEGDWILKEIKVKGRYITGPKELGITLGQIKKLLQLKKSGKLPKNFKVPVKYGIPFLPSFLLGYVALLIFGNWLVLFF